MKNLKLSSGSGLSQVTQPVSSSLVRAQASGLLDQCSSQAYPACGWSVHVHTRVCRAVSYSRLSLYCICVYASDHRDPCLPPSSCIFCLLLFLFSSLLPNSYLMSMLCRGLYRTTDREGLGEAQSLTSRIS